MTRWKTFALIALGAACMAAPLHADEPDSLPADRRIRLLEYDANDIYTITTRTGYQTNIEFNPREEIETISVGDRSYWQIIPSGNRLFIRPLQDDVSTNMTVITSRHSYQFDLASTGDKSRSITYVARFTYADDRAVPLQALADPFNYSAHNAAMMNPPATAPGLPPVMPLRPAAPPVVSDTEMAAPIPPPVHSAPVELSRDLPVDTAPKRVTTPAPVPSREAANRNYRYTFSGPESASPYEVYDDGLATYFRYRPPIGTAPEASGIARDGEEKTLSVYEKDGFFAVDGTAPVIVLRRAEGTVYLYNETLAPRH